MNFFEKDDNDRLKLDNIFEQFKTKEQMEEELKVILPDWKSRMENMMKFLDNERIKQEEKILSDPVEQKNYLERYSKLKDLDPSFDSMTPINP